MPRSSPVVVVYVLETCAYGPHISMYIRRRRRLTRTRLLFGECILPSSSPRGQVAKAHPTSLPPPARPSVTEPPPTEATNPSTSGYVARNNISRSEKERNNYYSLHSDIPQRHSLRLRRGRQDRAGTRILSPHQFDSIVFIIIDFLRDFFRKHPNSYIRCRRRCPPRCCPVRISAVQGDRYTSAGEWRRAQHYRQSVS